MTSENKPPLIIAGAGGFGYELKGQVSLYNMPYRFTGFLDNNKTGDEIIGTVNDHVPLPDMHYIAALGVPKTRHEVLRPLIDKNARFANLISPYAGIDSPITPNAGIIILGGGGISNNVPIGEHTLIHGLTVIGHDASIGSFCTLGAFVFIGGNVKVGSFVTIHPHASILPHIKIGEGAVIGAGSVVIKNVEAHTTVFGNPAKVIERRQP